MENSANSRICSHGEEDRCEATFHEDPSWSTSSSMDDLLMFDVRSTIHSSSYEFFQTRLCCSSAVDGGAQASASSFRLKRRKMAADDDLEDTATSPPHPSIVSKMDEPSSKQQKKQRATINQTKHKGKGSEDYGEVEDRIIQVGVVGRDNNKNYCSTGLKNIGLCLVPVSMALNYFA
ncbi:putative CTD small phosphatase-like protein 2 [Cucumis melo var. makuwa]|uniref:Uncharacterized protein LOC103501601 n=2 Tax=Cucumis melo TaxID=3656 RepID=A0A1S3CKU1_CUCME|nr:uncharacterized protein LOC103501601 [Cucumis melo]TYK00353.1 putative CTD small phosphatase-like protein 2 [Cucumis melo var. makuwa]